MVKINKKKLVYIIIIIILIILLLIFIYNKINKNKNKNSLFIEKFNNNNNDNNIIRAFTEVYDTNLWGDNQNSNYKGSSGSGSAIAYNEKTYVPFMQKFFKEYNIKSVVDLGCGDFVIGTLLYENTNIDYTGYDAYNGVIDNNNNRFNENKNFNFIHLDFTSESDRINLKTADLCIIKDVLQHLPNSIITNFMDYIIKSKKYKYILIINCHNTTPENTENVERQDIKAGEFSSLSALRHPLKIYNPKILYNWDTKEISLIET